MKNFFGGDCASCHRAAAVADFDFVCGKTHGCAPLGVTDAFIAIDPEGGSAPEDLSPALRADHARAPTRSRPCRRACARSRRRRAARAAPCSPRGARGSAPAARRGRARASPATGATIATTRWPNRSSGAPSTTASATSGCTFSTASTSSGYTFSPPVLMHSEPRPSRCTVPSASIVAMSPGSDQRTPSISTNVRALRSGSL